MEGESGAWVLWVRRFSYDVKGVGWGIKVLCAEEGKEGRKNPVFSCYSYTWFLYCILFVYLSIHAYIPNPT